MLAPIFSNALICKSTGLVPIEHPPGRLTLAMRCFASKGPKTRIDALIFLTISYSAIYVLGSPEIYAILFSILDFIPRLESRMLINLVSAKFGIESNLSSPLLKSKLQAISGRAEFFAPLILILPFNFAPPITFKLSIYYSFLI